MTTTSTVTIQIPAPLRVCCEGAPKLSGAARTVRSALEELERRYPSLYRSICDETGSVRPLRVGRGGVRSPRRHAGHAAFLRLELQLAAGFVPDPYPEYGQCVHKIAGYRDAPGRLYMQNHGGCGPEHPDIGVLRSDDHGRTWRSISKGLPSDFGFPIVVHPQDADTVSLMPLEAMTRTCPDGAPAVWRSTDGGGSWTRLARGLPEKESFSTVLFDDLASPALYFGTTTGQLWIGRDGGEAWSCLFPSLPPIHCVKVAGV